MCVCARARAVRERGGGNRVNRVRKTKPKEWREGGREGGSEEVEQERGGCEKVSEERETERKRERGIEKKHTDRQREEKESERET